MDSKIKTWIAELEVAKKVSANEEMTFFKNLEACGNGELITELCLQILENIEPTEGTLIPMQCASLLERFAPVSTVERLVQILKKLPPMTGLRDYRQDIRRAINKLELRKAGECVCKSAFTYNTSPYDSLYTVESSVFDEVNYETTYRARCNSCGRAYTVIENTSYHYPTYQWR